jgi:hydroxylamine reductase (hybrid-cluster protein)
VGQLPDELLQALEQAGGKPVNRFVRGGLRRPGLTPAADPGSPELLLGMRVDVLVIAPDAAWPSLETLAAKYGIPVLLAERGKSPEKLAAEAIELAAHHAQNAFYGSAARAIQAAPAGIGGLRERVPAIRAALAAGRVRGIAVLFGEAGVKQTGFERTLALLEAAQAEQALVLLGGELGSAAEALTAELARRQPARSAAFAKALAADGLSPIVSFGSAVELPGVVSLLHALGEGSGRVPVVVAFPEFYRASTWASAVALVSLGFNVQIGTRLPFWGSPWLAQALPEEWGKLTGGTLQAPPALPEARVQAEELARSLRAGSAG